jgi:hypothetical protein
MRILVSLAFGLVSFAAAGAPGDHDVADIKLSADQLVK